MVIAIIVTLFVFSLVGALFNVVAMGIFSRRNIEEKEFTREDVEDMAVGLAIIGLVASLLFIVLTCILMFI